MDIISAMLHGTLSTTGNLNYLYKFAYLATCLEPDCLKKA